MSIARKISAISAVDMKLIFLANKEICKKIVTGDDDIIDKHVPFSPSHCR